MRNFQGIILYELEHIGRFSNLYYGTFNFFIPLNRAGAITWENFVLAKRDAGSAKERSQLAGMKRFMCNRKI